MKDGILYVQHSKFGKVKGGFGAGRGFALICHDAGPRAGPSAAREAGTGERPLGTALGSPGLSRPTSGALPVGEGTHLCGHPLWLAPVWGPCLVTA